MADSLNYAGASRVKEPNAMAIVAVTVEFMVDAQRTRLQRGVAKFKKCPQNQNPD